MYNKKNEKYIDRSDLYFSHIWPNGIYCWNDQSVPDVTDAGGKSRNPLFMDVETDELFRAKKVYWRQNLNEYKYAVMHAPEKADVIWPVDLVELNHDVVTTVFVEPDYNVHIAQDDKEKDTNMVMLFPDESRGITMTVGAVLREIAGNKTHAAFNWKMPRIRSLMTEMLQMIQELNAEGYLFLDFDFDRMFVTGTGKIVTQYSHLLVGDKKTFHDAPEYVMDLGEYNLEFAMPAVVQGKVKNPSRSVQNYSLAAALFYLMTGRLAYDGPIIAGHPDRNAQEHMDKFIAYHNNPIFIFDEQDTSNRLGIFGSDQKIIDVWNELPDDIQDVFRRIFGKGAVSGQNPVAEETDAARWLELFKLLP